MLTRNEIVNLLSLRGREQEDLFACAVSHRRRSFGLLAKVRGVIEVTNICRVNCQYCPMRLDNTRDNYRYVVKQEEILHMAQEIRESGIRIVFMQGGEIPQTTRLVGEVIPEVRRIFDNDVEVLLCLGNKTKEEYAYLRKQGADSYILKHETVDLDLHERIRESSWHERRQCLVDLLDLGYRVGTGVIVGLPGQTLDSLADDLIFAKEMGVHMMSASPFVPAPNTPLERSPAGDPDLALNFIAVSRIVEPSWLIPSVSAFEVLKEGGQGAALSAGANVMTANFTPPSRRDKYLIYGKDRFVVQLQHIREVLRRASLCSDLDKGEDCSARLEPRIL